MFKIIKSGLSFGILLLFIGMASRQTAACQLTIVPADFSATLGEEVAFRVERTQTCGRCLLPLEDTTIGITGGALVGEPRWQDGNGHPDILQFKAKFSQTGPVKVIIERICPKNHTTVAATGAIHPISVATSGPAQLSDKPVNSVKPPVIPPAAAITKQQSPSSPAQPGPDSAQISDAPVPQPSNAAAQTTITHFDRKQPAPSFAFLTPWLLLLPVGLGLFLLKKTWLRRTLLVVSLIGLGFYYGGCPCPIGSVFNYLTPNRPQLLILILLILIPLLTTLIWGRFFCGWICPVGAVQELIHAKNFKRRPQFFRMDRGLKYLKFLVLILVIYLTLQTGRNLFCQFEPFKMLFGFHGNLVTGIILSVILLTAIIIKRPFCRYLCPLGAILALVARFSVFKIKPSPASCFSCGVCTKDRCPMDAIAMDAVNKVPVIDHMECIQCGNCVDSCKQRALSTGFGSKTAKSDKAPTHPVISS
jgi:ferredoxin